MRINEPLLRERLRFFVNSSDSALLRAAIGTSLLMGVAVSMFFGCIGLLMIPTIVWTWKGLKVLWQAATLEAYRTDEGNELLKNPDKLLFLIAHGVIIGPQGFGLVIGSLDPDQNRVFPLLARLSREFANLYKQGPSSPADLEMVQLLREDAYRPGRRRLVPKRYTGDLELYLFDLYIDLSGAYNAGHTTLVACVGTPEERGVIVQVPWSYVAQAIEL